MTQRSQRHHEIPIWLQTHFCQDDRKTLWLGVKATRQIVQVGVNEAFVRRNANTRIDYSRGKDGVVVPVKSDRDEKILARFDADAASADRRLIALAREWQRFGSTETPFSPEDLEICKRIILAQFRRTRESQDEIGLTSDDVDLHLDLLFQRAEEQGQDLPSRQALVEAPGVRNVLAELSQNHRANFASADHPILADKEQEFLQSHGLRLAVVTASAGELIIGSHGVTILEATLGQDTWLPLAPDVAIALSAQPRKTIISTHTRDFVEAHNLAVLSASDYVAASSREVVERAFKALD